MKKFVNYLCAIALLALTACNSATVITPETDAVAFTIDGGEQKVSVTTDGTWSISDCPGWVKTSVEGNVISIIAERNETGALREGDIVLSGKGDVKAIIKVSQVVKCTHITPSADKLEFGKEGGTQTLNIDTDGMLQVEATGGYTATYAGGVLTVTAPSNDEGAKRGEIKLTADDQSITIYASQKGNTCKTCGGSGKITCPQCHGKGWYPIQAAGGGACCERCGGYEPGVTDGSAGEPRTGSGRIKCPDCGGTGKEQ
ncbi:MAG: hypothetical protein IKX31_09030 [Muribaculaceae bacterium]|nr:hypothetical protein [Muribaculaceae bacterium]